MSLLSLNRIVPDLIRFQLGLFVAASVVGCTGSKDPWKGWSNNPTPPTVVNPSVLKPQPMIKPKSVPYNLSLGNWQNVSPQELFHVIPSSSPRMGFQTNAGFVYGSANATVLIPKNAPPKLLNGDYWNLIGKLPDGSVIGQTDSDVLHKLDISSGQFSQFLDLRAAQPHSTFNSEVVSTSSGLLVTINDAGTNKSGAYLIKQDASLKEVLVSNGMWSTVSFKSVFGSDKYVVLTDYDRSSNYLFSGDTQQLSEIPNQGASILMAAISKNGDIWYLDEQYRLIRGYQDGRFDIYTPNNTPPTDGSILEYATLMLAMKDKVYVAKSDGLFALTISGVNYSIKPLTALSEGQEITTLSAFAQIYDPFYLISDDAFYLAVTGADPQSDAPINGILEVNADDSTNLLPAEFDINSASGFMRVSPSEVLVALQDEQSDFNLLVRVKPGETKQVFKPDNLTGDIISHGVSFVAQTDTNRWLMGSHSALMLFDSKSNLLRQIEGDNQAETQNRHWLSYKNGYVYSLDRVQEDSKQMILTVWKFSGTDQITPVGSHYFEVPLYHQISQTRMESGFTSGALELSHFWLKFSNGDTGGELIYDLFLDFDTDKQKLIARPLPSSNLGDSNFGSPFARNSEGEFWEITNQGLFKETVPASFARVDFDGVPQNARVLDIAASGKTFGVVLFDPGTAMTVLVARQEDEWFQLEPTTWMHSDLWIAPDGKLQWKVLDPTNNQVAKILFLNEKLESLTEFPWNTTCSAESENIPNLATFGITSTNFSNDSIQCIFK